MIEYFKLYNGNTRVILEGKIVGYIKPIDGGYQYFPVGSKTAGNWYQTEREVKQSLE